MSVETLDMVISYLSFIRPLSAHFPGSGNLPPATTARRLRAAVADKLPLSLAPLFGYRGSVESLTDDFNSPLSADIDSPAPLIVKK